MAVSAPKLVGILDRLQDNLEATVATVGTNYVFAADRVYQVVDYADTRLFDGSVGADGHATIYAIRAGDGRDAEFTTGDSTGGYVTAEVEVFILAARFWGGADETTSAVEIKEQLIRDVKRVLFTDPTLASLVHNIADGDLTVNRDFPIDAHPEGWIVAEIAFPVRYSYHVTAP